MARKTHKVRKAPKALVVKVILMMRKAIADQTCGQLGPDHFRMCIAHIQKQNGFKVTAR